MVTSAFVVFVATSVIAVSNAAPNSKSRYPTLQVPEECRNQTGLCAVKPEWYDELAEEINKLLPDNIIEDFIDRDSLLGPQLYDDGQNCPYYNETKHYYLDPQNPHNIIVQTSRCYQKLETITCAKHVIDSRLAKSSEKNLECFQGNRLESLWSTSCQQTETAIKLVVFNTQSRELGTAIFNIPTCCNCRISNIELK